MCQTTRGDEKINKKLTCGLVANKVEIPLQGIGGISLRFQGILISEISGCNFKDMIIEICFFSF